MIEKMHIGVFLGLLAMAVQYFSLVFSGKFARESGRNIFALLAPAFAAMAVPSLVALPFFWGPDLPPFRAYAGTAMLCMFFCVAGNAAVFCMLKTVDASRVSPLIAFKVPVLALFYFVLRGEQYTAWQWLGVLLVVPAGWLLCKAGRPIPARALAWLGLGVVCYDACDYCIGLLLETFGPCGAMWRGPMLAFLVMHAAGGVYGAAGMACGLWPGRAHLARSVLPFALFWFLSLGISFPCFAMIGLVNGNIVQSSRGLIAVGLGWCVARAGFGGLEEPVTAAVFFRRVVSGLLLILAAVLFNLAR